MESKKLFDYLIESKDLIDNSSSDDNDFRMNESNDDEDFVTEKLSDVEMVEIEMVEIDEREIDPRVARYVRSKKIEWPTTIDEDMQQLVDDENFNFFDYHLMNLREYEEQRDIVSTALDMEPFQFSTYSNAPENDCEDAWLSSRDEGPWEISFIRRQFPTVSDEVAALLKFLADEWRFLLFPHYVPSDGNYRLLLLTVVNLVGHKIFALMIFSVMMIAELLMKILVTAWTLTLWGA